MAEGVVWCGVVTAQAQQHDDGPSGEPYAAPFRWLGSAGEGEIRSRVRVRVAALSWYSSGAGLSLRRECGDMRHRHETRVALSMICHRQHETGGERDRAALHLAQ